jgi:hypothetical protein
MKALHIEAKDMRKMTANKPIDLTAQEVTNYDLLYRLYDFILSPEWEALEDDDDQLQEETAEEQVVPDQLI